ncbi:signal recognition particle 54 kDa protein 2 isoform X1 [Sorghum bicolor]|jgi:signal recognition particle subunit SRP54|uniref:signal recognition particle 54 kDa protein 2 isoform X1 n=1 Tax=Sorghum bicolor TaxID=4558 RepID=UPI0001A82B85|nr:signal recognition particle 54 kDa protein 2 isoform X1 [Sorghum bicolor]|eukprot:XP_002466776.1 signal recognition particle 54 kDa protein 2 isoform X1 [Sorghum bicolor]
MVLSQLSGSLKGALSRMCNATLVDQKVLDDCLNEISRALLQADVRFETVRRVQATIKSTVNLQALADGTNKRRVIHRAVVAELRRTLDPGKPSFAPTKGRKPASVVMFVGLQGSGKTTTCVKYADYHRRHKGLSPALVCADTFRAGAFDQLKQNATKAGIPFYGSHTESDPVKVAVEGVDRFRDEDACDLIVVDTSGRHRQEAALLEEMRQVADATRPDLVVFVMDASIGQAAFQQAQAFRQSTPVGAVIVTKMDGHAKGGGALSAVAATKSPVIFIGTGEHIPDLEAFDAKSFVSRLLGLGDLSGLMDKMHGIPAYDNRSPYQILEELTKENFTLRALRKLFRAMLSMGPLGQLVSMIPGLISDRFSEKEGHAKMKRYMTMMDSMTDAELDGTSTKLMNQSRIKRVARGSGRPVRDVVDMLEEHKRMAKMMSKLPNVKRPNDINTLVNAIPQPLLNQFGGKFGLQSLIRQMGAQN